jgi:hypothetical protein
VSIVPVGRHLTGFERARYAPAPSSPAQGRPSASIRCMMTAILWASATLAFFQPRLQQLVCRGRRASEQRDDPPISWIRCSGKRFPRKSRRRACRARPIAIGLRSISAATSARTRGDSIIYVPQERIVYLSELYFAEQFLWIWLKSLDAVEALGAEIFVPAHGPIPPNPRPFSPDLIDIRD